MNGKLNLPETPQWNLRQMRSANLNFEYENIIGYGSDCQESKVVINGNGRVSERQKEYSTRSVLL